MSAGPRYEIKDLIAAGGMAEVYRGESSGIEGFRKKVAIKRVLPKLSANEEFINMFLDEARLCAYLTHSRCVQVFDIGKGAGSHFIVMEYVDGADLKAVQETLRASGEIIRPEVACLIGLQICEGLAYAHQARDHAGQPLDIVHRDISPHNVLMTRYGEVKLVDFGLARASSHLTAEDEEIVKGKFGYLAPEVTLRQGVDHRADLFAAGILLWEMLAGRRLFLGNSDLETFKQVQAAEIPDLRKLRSDISDNLWKVLQKALWRDRNYRYQTANAFAHDLALVLAQSKQAVTYQDVAVLVQAAADKRPPVQAQKASADLIGELILDTLHDFSDSPDDAASTPVVPKRAPVTEYEDPTAWGLDDAMRSSAPPPRQAPPPGHPPPPPAASVARAVPPLPMPPERRPIQGPPSRRPKHRSLAPHPTAAADPADGGPFWRRWFG